MIVTQFHSQEDRAWKDIALWNGFSVKGTSAEIEEIRQFMVSQGWCSARNKVKYQDEDVVSTPEKPKNGISWIIRTRGPVPIGGGWCGTRGEDKAVFYIYFYGVPDKAMLFKLTFC